MKSIALLTFGYLFFTLPSFFLAIKAGEYVGSYENFAADIPTLTQFMLKWHPASFVFVVFVSFVYLIDKSNGSAKWLKLIVTTAAICQVFWFYLVYAGLFLPIITLSNVI